MCWGGGLLKLRLGICRLHQHLALVVQVNLRIYIYII